MTTLILKQSQFFEFFQETYAARPKCNKNCVDHFGGEIGMKKKLGARSDLVLRRVCFFLCIIHFFAFLSPLAKNPPRQRRNAHNKNRGKHHQNAKTGSKNKILPAAGVSTSTASPVRSWGPGSGGSFSLTE